MVVTLRRIPYAYLGVALLLLAEGWAVATGEKKLVAVSVAPVVVALLRRRSWLPIASLTLLVAVANPSAYRIGQATVPLLLMVAGLMAVAFDGMPRLEVIGRWLLVLVAATFIGALVGSQTVGLHAALLAARDASLLPAYWLALAGFQRDFNRTLAVIANVAGVVSSLAILQWLAGPAHHFFLSANLRDESGVFRVRPPGQLLPYIALVFAASYVFWGPRVHRRRALLLAGLTGAATLITLNRDMVAGTAAGLLVALVLARPSASGFMKLAAAAVVAVLALGFASGTGIGKRILSLGNPQYLQQTTLSDRHYENGFAKQALHRHPIFGVGWGAPYGAQVTTVVNHVNVVQQRGFIHNQYLGLWLRDGLLGLGAMIAMLLISFRTGVRFGRGNDERRWLGSAVAGALVALSLSSIVGIFILEPSSSVIVMVLLALAAALRGELLASADSDEGEPAV
jgi:O-antigen ligase